ncbi:hypothetical protein M0802_001106 [Mischocyttarus mexicanus]|nr:hypothetical protein M0802_001106 [Mischocyttarus mexicanus]
MKSVVSYRWQSVHGLRETRGGSGGGDAATIAAVGYIGGGGLSDADELAETERAGPGPVHLPTTTTTTNTTTITTTTIRVILVVTTTSLA